MTEVLAIDIGGTHARFALAEIDGARVAALRSELVLKTAECASLQIAWEKYCDHIGRPPPREAGIAIACPVTGDLLKLTNNPWVIRRSLLLEQMKLDRLTLINDFAAVGHAVAHCPPSDFVRVCGSDAPLPETGSISVIGPGTGLGVAILRKAGPHYDVVATEGGHVAFAPIDTIEDSILAFLRQKFERVSVERVVSGPGLANIHEALAALDGRALAPMDDKMLWAAAIAGEDSLAAAALERFFLAFGAIAGDVALVHGANSVVIAGGLGLRLIDHLPASGFAQRFAAKGRFAGMMGQIPVKLITHRQPGLLGAAAAFIQEHAA